MVDDIFVDLPQMAFNEYEIIATIKMLSLAHHTVAFIVNIVAPHFIRNVNARNLLFGVCIFCWFSYLLILYIFVIYKCVGIIIYLLLCLSGVMMVSYKCVCVEF